MTIKIKPGIIKKIRFRHCNDTGSRNSRGKRRHHDLRMSGFHAFDGADHRGLLPTRDKSSRLRIAKFRALREANGRILAANRDLAFEISLKSPCDAVVARMKDDRPVAEVDARLVRREVNRRFFVNRRRERTVNSANRCFRRCANPIQKPLTLDEKRNPCRLDNCLAASPDGICHPISADLKPQFVLSIRRNRAECFYLVRKSDRTENHHTQHGEYE